MNIIETPFKGLFILKMNNFQDNRGRFQKLFNYDFFLDNGLETNFREFYYSISNKDVIRGMHFQIPPLEHVKLVYVSKGRIIDVVVDLRKNSETFGKYYVTELNDEQGQYLYISKGFAHGFLSLEERSIVNYAQTSCYSREHDAGILYNSFGYDWPVANPVISDRDLTFNALWLIPIYCLQRYSLVNRSKMIKRNIL